jgi:hypothetical protein
MVKIASITDFKNKHLNSDIYVLASGKSMDYYPKNFFNDKITIGVNQIHNVINCSYTVRKEIPINMIENIFSSEITLFLSRGKCGNHIPDFKDVNIDLINNRNNPNDKSTVIIYEHDENIHIMPTSLPNSDLKLLVSHSTITTAIHLAAYMGAKNIFIAGHDLGKLNGQINCSNYHTAESMSAGWLNDKDGVAHKYTKWLGQIKNHTQILKSMLYEKYKCNIVTLSPFTGFGFDGNKFEPS